MEKKTKTAKAPYTKEEIEEIRKFLLQEERRIENRFNGSKKSMEPIPQTGDEAAEVGSENFLRDTGITLMMEDSKRLRMIKESIAKLEHGEFGICQDCGKPIGIARLRAKPYARYCVDCKEKRELRGDNSSDSII